MDRITPADVREMYRAVCDSTADKPPSATTEWLEDVIAPMFSRLATQMEDDAVAMAGKVLVPREIAQWTHDLLKRRLNMGEKGEWLEPWRDSELGKRDQRWVDALAPALADSVTDAKEGLS